MLRKLLIAFTFAAFATPALASQCPMLMQQVDSALQTAQLSDADKAKVAELRLQGERLHASGQHADSEAALNQALVILGN